MVNVVLCDDNENDLSKIVSFIDDYMIKREEEYKKYIFTDYGQRFIEFTARRLPSRIYILDIETPSRSGIDIAREIRKKDIDSIIIFLTGHEELGNIVLKSNLMFLSFINKFDDCKNKLKECLDNAMQLLNKKQVLKFNDRNTIYTIKLDEILYITKESFERKTVIKTDYTEFKVNLPLNEIKEMLDNRFVQTHRSCIINRNRATKIYKQKRTITFDTGEVIDLVSEMYRKELV